MSETAQRDPGGLWEQLTFFSDTYTCYSAAVATWAAWEHVEWQRLVDPGLWLTVGERGDGLFAFAHFRPGLRAMLGLVRTGTGGAAAEAAASVLAEMRRGGRVIVAGDGFHLPWHVAFERRHVPHWYVLVDAPEGPTVLDPFACRNELGLQAASRHVVDEDQLERIITGLPGDHPVFALREALALGDDAGSPPRLPYQWYMRSEVHDQHPPPELAPANSAIESAPADSMAAPANSIQEQHPLPELAPANSAMESAPADFTSAPADSTGPDAVLLLAAHFRTRGQEPSAYVQADDIWSIARHRAFMCRAAQQRATVEGDAALTDWVGDHAAPLAKKWGHIAPLLMQASLALGAGRAASASVPDTLEQLAGLERSAAAAFAEISSTI
jgi:hypothetical protein